MPFDELWDDDGWWQTWFVVLKKRNIVLPFKVHNLECDGENNNFLMKAVINYKGNICLINNIVLTNCEDTCADYLFNATIHFVITDNEIITDQCYFLY